jgi:hypothetical protein
MTLKLSKIKMSIPILLKLIQTRDANEWSEPISGEDYLAMLARGEL